MSEARKKAHERIREALVRKRAAGVAARDALAHLEWLPRELAQEALDAAVEEDAAYTALATAGGEGQP